MAHGTSGTVRWRGGGWAMPIRAGGVRGAMAAAGLCGEWCGESTRPVRAPSAAAGLGTCTCQRAQREARGRAAAVCGVGGESDSGDQSAALQVGWSTDAGRDTLAVWWARRARGAGRAGARQGRRCLAAAGLTSARRLPRADTRPTGMFLSHLDGGCDSPVWGAVQRRGMCRPPCPALLHGRTLRSRWHGGRGIWSDAPRVRRAGWPWAAVLWVRAVAGGRQTQPSRPQPAADTLSERHHATAPGHPAPRVRRRVARAVRGWEMAIRDWQALAGGRRAWWRRDGAVAG